MNAVAPKPFRWVLDITWLNLVELNKLTVFSNLLNKVGDLSLTWLLFSNKNNLYLGKKLIVFSSKFDLDKTKRERMARLVRKRQT